MPANRENARSITRLAGFDASAAKYKFVKINASGLAVLAGSGERAIGVANGNGVENHALPIDISGRVLVELGASVAAGAVVQSDASGLCITQASTGIVMGTAFEGGVAGDVVSIDFAPQGAP